MMFNKPEKVLNEIEKAAAAQNMPGNVVLPIIGREKGSVLENVIKENQPKAVLEIGTLVGYSSILMAKNLKKGRITSIEANKKNSEAAKLNIQRAGLSDKIEIINGDALEIIPGLDNKFDMIVLDEILVSLKMEYLDENIIIELLKNKPGNLYLILTGRGASEKLIAAADLVSDIRAVKHPYHSKTPYALGIEL